MTAPDDKSICGPNFALYRRMSEPKASVDVAEKDIGAFLSEVSEARQRYGLRDVHILVSGTLADPEVEGGERHYDIGAHFGDPTHAFHMLKAELSREAAEMVRGLPVEVRAAGAKAKR